MEQSTQKELISTIRSLSIAVWVLVVIGIVNLGIYFYSSRGIYKSVEESANIQLQPEELKPVNAKKQISAKSYPEIPFHELGPKETIERSKVIFMTKNVDKGDKMVCIITEVLKKANNYTFYYKPGDEYQSCSRFKKPNTRYGGGSIHFISEGFGLVSSSSIYGDRIPGLNDIPLSLFKEMITKSQKQSQL